MQTIETDSLTPRRKAAVMELLAKAGIGWDDGVEYTVLLEDDDGRALATGSRQDNVLKCIGVDPDAQGEGLAATVVTRLATNAARKGYGRLFIFTTPKSARLFGQLGFYPLAATADAALLENSSRGVDDFVAGLENPPVSGLVSAIVANCNPFSRGHRYLVETAARGSALVHLFVLSTDKSRFSTADRTLMVREGTADLANVVVHPGGDYLISPATFPAYFIKDKARVGEINCELDLALFAERIARPLGIRRRYVGTEPTDAVTRAYNELMLRVLPGRGVEVVEVPRLETDGAAVSASRIRRLLDEGRFDEIEKLAPPTTTAHLRGMFGKSRDT